MKRGARAIPPSPRAVLVIVTRRIGDVLLATPLIRSVKQAWPEAALDVLVFEGTEGVIAANPDVRRIVTVPQRPRLARHLALLAGCWRRYDVALSLVPGDRPTFYAFVAGNGAPACCSIPGASAGSGACCIAGLPSTISTPTPWSCTSRWRTPSESCPATR